MSVKFCRNILFSIDRRNNAKEIYHEVTDVLNISYEDYYLEQNGKILRFDSLVEEGKTVTIIPRLLGGKGGFGSMLRAIGAQIEKTTNREACRDLSGRRLRDINEEQRLKNWIATQTEREKEAAERKKKKLEKLCQEPKHEFHDEFYDKERSELPERVEDAVLQGLEASCSTKRPAEEDSKKKMKKRKLWVDADLEELSSSSDEGSSDIEEDNKSSEDSSSLPAEEISLKENDVRTVTAECH